MILKIEIFLEVPPKTSARAVENEVDVWIKEMCEQQGDWLWRDTTVMVEAE